MTLDSIESVDHMAQDELLLNPDLTVKKFGQVMQDKLLMVSPGAASRDRLRVSG